MGVFDIEKKESIKTLILTLWKRDDEAPTREKDFDIDNFLVRTRTFNTKVGEYDYLLNSDKGWVSTNLPLSFEVDTIVIHKILFPDY